MNGMTIESKADKYIISIDKNTFSKDFILELIERVSLEEKITRADFDESILDLADEIKKDWWEKNKKDFINAQMSSSAYKEWISDEDDIYDEVFKDEKS